MVGGDRVRRAGDFNGTRLFSVATRILVEAMEASAVKRLICVTGLGAGDSRGHGGFLHNAVLCLILGRRQRIDDRDRLHTCKQRELCFSSLLTLAVAV